jgi:TrmH family RNA methyltransferase
MIRTLGLVWIVTPTKGLHAMKREQVTSRDNRTIKEMRKLLTDRAARREESLFVCDGYTMLEEALAHGAVLVTLACAQNAALPDLPDSARVLELPERLLDSLAPTGAHQGVMFTCRLPALSTPAAPVSGRHVLLDRIQDPGNLGSILRSASAFGLDSVLLTPGCADPFSPKTIRAAMGAVFRQQIWEIMEIMDWISTCTLPLRAAARREDARSLRETRFETDALLLLGNEGAGLSRDLLSRAGSAVWIPLYPGCESLGVAAAAAILFHAWQNSVESQ